MSVWSKEMKGVVSVVTGGGKTFFALMCVIRFLKKHPSGKVLIIVPTTALQDQWSIEVSAILGVSEKTISRFPGKTNFVGVFNVLIINTARKIDKSLFEKSPSFLIVDECHRAGSKENSKALGFDSVAELGLSATPKRENDSGFEDFIRPKLGQIIYNYNYEDAFRDGVISSFDVTNIRTYFNPEEKANYQALSKRIAIELGKKAPSHKNVERLLIARSSISKNSVKRIPAAVKVLKEHVGKKIIVFTESIEQASLIDFVLKKYGLLSVCYHSKIEKNIRFLNLEQFYKGYYNILITCTALDEGLNVPDIEVALIVSQTMSGRQRIQRIGRALRTGKNMAHIYTIYITDEEKDLLMKEFGALNRISNFRWIKTQE